MGKFNVELLFFRIYFKTEKIITESLTPDKDEFVRIHFRIQLVESILKMKISYYLCGCKITINITSSDRPFQSVGVSLA